MTCFYLFTFMSSEGWGDEFVCAYVFPSNYPATLCTHTYPLTCPFTHPPSSSIRLPTHLPIHPFIHPSIHLSIYPSPREADPSFLEVLLGVRPYAGWARKQSSPGSCFQEPLHLYPELRSPKAAVKRVGLWWVGQWGTRKKEWLV